MADGEGRNSSFYARPNSDSNWISIDIYNMSFIKGGVAKTLNNRATDSDHIPCVMVIEPRSPDGEPRVYTDGVCPTINTCGGATNTVRNDDKCYSEERYGEYKLTETSISLRHKSASCGGAAR